MLLPLRSAMLCGTQASAAHLSSSAGVPITDAGLGALAIPLAQKPDEGVMVFSWTQSPKRNQAMSSVTTKCVYFSVSLILYHIFSLHLVNTAFHSLLFPAFLPSLFAVGPPSSADIWFAFRNETE